jgi:hypothetical protein
MLVCEHDFALFRAPFEPLRAVRAWRRRKLTGYYTHHGPVIREVEGKWGSGSEYSPTSV